MATLKACVQKMRNDGFYPVYIRVTHNRTTQYIKTDKMVTKRELSRSKEITDPVVMQFCTALILDYNERLNRTDTRNWTARMVVDYLQKGEEDLCFSDDAKFRFCHFLFVYLIKNVYICRLKTSQLHSNEA